MRGNSWRLLGVMLLVSIPTVFVVALIFGGIVTGFHIDSVGDETPPLGLFLLRGVVSACANVLVVALNGAALAGFYRRLANTRGDGAALRTDQL